MAGDTRRGIAWEVVRALGTEGPDPPFGRSCRVYGHSPTCGTYLGHLQRLETERTAAGGEAELKARAGYWARTESVEVNDVD